MTRDYGAEAEAIMGEAIGKLVALAEERYNETCDCPEIHQLGVASWAVVYEHVDMREGGSLLASPEVLHSSNSYPHASGLLKMGAAIIDTAVLHRLHG